MKNIFKTKEAKRRIATEDFNNKNNSLWKRIISLFKIAFTAVGKQDNQTHLSSTFSYESLKTELSQTLESLKKDFKKEFSIDIVIYEYIK